MKVLILAGGFGTRLSEYTNEIPKPMVPIGNIPIIVHIMSLYAKYGYKEFVVATGYKSNIINDYFKDKSKNIKTLSEIKVELEFQFNANNSSDVWKITLLYTGEKTMTGGRVKRAKDEIKESKFLMTYGDGISNIRIDDLVDHHSASKKLATLSAVRPPVRFGELELDGINVTNFAEKPRLQKGWINGGFFVFERDIFDFIGGDEIMLEREPLEKLVEINQLIAYKHDNFWQCMDSKRDKDLLEKMYKKNKFLWL